MKRCTHRDWGYTYWGRICNKCGAIQDVKDKNWKPAALTNDAGEAI